MIKRILFFAETVTLAHFARPVALAKGLDSSNYEVVIACDARYRRFLEDEPWQVESLQSISSEQFLQALASGSPVYDVKTLRRYVKDDLNLIEKVKPDMILGDFRLSLSTSARLVGIPYTTIANAYWSPYYTRTRYPLPDLPMTKVLPLPIAEMLFRLGRRFVFRQHCEPLNSVRLEHGLASLGSDLCRVYTDADYTLYADLPEIFPIKNLPSNHHYIGPILWSPPVAKPAWWDNLPTDKPIVYLTLGSSGSSLLLPELLQALSELPITVVAATTGTCGKLIPPANVYIADYLPGIEAAARSELVICNGGSLTTQQALTAGVPVLGIAGNMDQFMNMDALVKAGVGMVLRVDRLSVGKIRTAVTKMISCRDFAVAAKNLADNEICDDAPQKFATFIDRVMR